MNTTQCWLKGDVSHCDRIGVVLSGVLDSRAELQSTISYNGQCYSRLARHNFSVSDKYSMNYRSREGTDHCYFTCCLD